MMIRATVPSGIGLLFTSWKFDSALILVGVVTVAAVSYLRWILRAGKLAPVNLAVAAGFYAAFGIGLLVTA
ncbi:MAG: cation:H+ antiporter [Pseudonocardiales bacterium]|jgi:cation:H+ antiporter|nr:cation:H+ antiporter [Pseudonocardiales bacterium]